MLRSLAFSCKGKSSPSASMCLQSAAKCDLRGERASQIRTKPAVFLGADHCVCRALFVKSEVRSPFYRARAQIKQNIACENPFQATKPFSTIVAWPPYVKGYVSVVCGYLTTLYLFNKAPHHPCSTYMYYISAMLQDP